jgi:hypothetical protein
MFCKSLLKNTNVDTSFFNFYRTALATLPYTINSLWSSRTKALHRPQVLTNQHLAYIVNQAEKVNHRFI